MDNNINNTPDDMWEALAEQIGETFQKEEKIEETQNINDLIDQQVNENRKKIEEERQKSDVNKEALAAAEHTNEHIYKQAKSIDNNENLSEEANREYKKVRLAALKILGINMARLVRGTVKAFRGIHARIKEKDIEEIKKDLAKAYEAKERYVGKIKAKSDVRIQNFNLKQLKHNRPTYDKEFLYKSNEALKINDYDRKIKALENELAIVTDEYDRIMGKYKKNVSAIGRLTRRIEDINISRGKEVVLKDVKEEEFRARDEYAQNNRSKPQNEPRNPEKNRSFKEEHNKSFEKEEKLPGDKAKFDEYCKIRKSFFEKYEKDSSINRYVNKENGTEAPYGEYKLFKEANKYFYEHKDEFMKQKDAQKDRPQQNKDDKREYKKENNTVPDRKIEEAKSEDITIALIYYHDKDNHEYGAMAFDKDGQYKGMEIDEGICGEIIAINRDGNYLDRNDGSPFLNKEPLIRDDNTILLRVNKNLGINDLNDERTIDSILQNRTFVPEDPIKFMEAYKKGLLPKECDFDWEKAMDSIGIRCPGTKLAKEFESLSTKTSVTPEEQLRLDYLNELRFGIDQGFDGFSADVVEYYESQDMDIDKTGIIYASDNIKTEYARQDGIDFHEERPLPGVGSNSDERIAAAINKSKVSAVEMSAPVREKEEREEDVPVRSLV